MPGAQLKYVVGTGGENTAFHAVIQIRVEENMALAHP